MTQAQGIKRPALERTVLTVGRHEGGWAVERGGEYSGHSDNKEEAKAAATKQARLLHDAGTPCQVVVSGDVGYFVHPTQAGSVR